MSVRLFHSGARMVVPLPGQSDRQVWWAVHRRPVAWGVVFRPTLALVGFSVEGTDGALRFGSGSLHWTTRPFWTTIRLQLPPSSPRKAALLTAGLLKAARYADERGG